MVFSKPGTQKAIEEKVNLRQVTESEAAEFARRCNLIWLGETSCKDDNNCMDIFRALLERVHLT